MAMASGAAWSTLGRVPSYAYRCRSCGDTFEMNRPMAESSDPASCPQGHDDTVKLLTTFGTVTRGSAPSAAPVPPMASGGGCCGGGGCC
ncbi:zinc ribbon domain-containing protein [Nocardia yamanashiensis]|uniref:FmdB family zinc ribbon protein n=1 Tax=Nocardia yamanashiensis TaxID=209247 RepID=UPI001E461220|nr:zinc ribbon domain-containing protein [Nocardia yamanashiensis]UGT38573.1 zinc ribbon domain-containing protein [Nocardia yamanashiensis]